MILPLVREYCRQHGRRNCNKFLVIILCRSSAVGTSFLNTLLSNTSHRKRLAESRIETGVARLLPRKETLISFQGPVRPVARHYFWFKITAGQLLVIQPIEKLLANVEVDIRPPGFDYIVQYCTNYNCYFRASWEYNTLYFH